MNKSKLKTYAPQARKDFIAAVTARANLLGLSEAGGKLEVASGERKGDLAIIAGREWPVKVYEQRERLIKHIQTAGFSQTIEAVAYTWFNRFAALRYMEIHDYLDHGHRVLSNRAGGMPEILNHATELELPGFNKTKAVELKLAGNKDGELYKMLLVAQCNALSRAMPFLFERIDDETELLLPDNLLRTDSIVAKLVEAIPEEDWQEVEIIGWLYQFYISEKKDEVIGKVVKSEDIPAATQLFTPNWIVQYLVQNSVGRLWLMANPASTLNSQWPYYIQPAEQTPEVQAQLDALIRARCLEGVVSDQWPVARGDADGNYTLSGIDRLAKGNELGGTGVSSHQGVSERGNLRTDQSGTTGSGINTVQHSRGAGAQIKGGIQQLSFDSTGIEGGGGNANLDSCSFTVSNSRASHTDAFAAGRNLENARHLADTPSLTTSHWSLTTPPLNPETITVLDPACGSGHILVVAYDVLKAIYLERGYQLRAIPRLILEKNLYGLDIDDRAAQLAGFALLMKARADDRRLFDNPPKLNVLALQESNTVASDQWSVISNDTSLATAHSSLITVFKHAKTFGSLIQIPPELNAQLPALAEDLQQIILKGDLYAQAAAQDLLPLVRQARVLGMQFDAVVANPPYMGGKGMNPSLKDYAKATFPDSKSDLFAMFMERGFGWCKPTGVNSMVTMQSWMFLSSYEAMREKLLSNRTLSNMVHMGNGVMGIAFGTAATVFLNKHIDAYEGSFSYCENDDVNEDGIPIPFPVKNERLKIAKPDNFKKIPGSPVAYWISDRIVSAFSNGLPLNKFSEIKQGMATSDNARFLRYWHEASVKNIAFDCMTINESQTRPEKWYPYKKGGSFRKWYGNDDYVVNWHHNGKELKEFQSTLNQGWHVRLKSREFYFKQSINWTFTSSSHFGIRQSPMGFIFDVAGSSLFPEAENIDYFTGLLCSKPVTIFLDVLNPTISYQVENIAAIPILESHLNAHSREISEVVRECLDLSKEDWDSSEISWGFSCLKWVSLALAKESLSASWFDWQKQKLQAISRLRELENENNRIFIQAYGLQDELSPEVPEDQITLARADREKDCQRLISYAIGCMMGRYSLDEPGLIYAHAGNVGFDATRYLTFPADTDGIVPLTDELWFEDDAANRIREFLLAVWGDEAVVSDQCPVASEKLTTNHSPLSTNMQWLAESLGKKGNETPIETIRRYLSGSFFKDHLQTYKKRPIYWLFSSGKQGAFQALVYLHRYHEGTLARMRSEYVVPLTGKIQSRIEMLTKDAEAATSTAARNKLNKEIEGLRKKHVELLSYDEKLRHYADMRIKLDLDDGVKVNYGKFGDLLSDVKSVTGGKDEE